jgi:sugar fermentation stimulation protein A
MNGNQEGSAFSFDLFSAELIERDSRVSVIASSEEGEFRAHLRNTGRLNDFIYPGARIVCQWKQSGKTDARVVGAIDGGSYVLLDTHVQEKLFAKELRAGDVGFLPELESVNEQEACQGKRFDYGVVTPAGKGFIELKSAVSCKDGWASYPDAPSRRGLEHVRTLTELARESQDVYVVFVVTHPDCDKFRPNAEVHPDMAEALHRGREAGVKLFATKMVLGQDGSVRLIADDIPVRLGD